MSMLHIIRICHFDFKHANLMKSIQPRAQYLCDQCENRSGDFLDIIYLGASKYRLSGSNYASSSIKAFDNCANCGRSAETSVRYGVVSLWRGSYGAFGWV